MIAFVGMKADPTTVNSIEAAIVDVVKFSRDNGLGLEKSEDFITKATVFATKEKFDKHVEGASDWKKGAKVPASFVGFGENKEFKIVSWPAFNKIHPKESPDEYRKLLRHEITHLLHSAYLKGEDEKMGPIWFYEGFACLVAEQYLDSALPKDLPAFLARADRGNYQDYAAIVRALSRKVSIAELLKKAQEKGFNDWASAQLAASGEKVVIHRHHRF